MILYCVKRTIEINFFLGSHLFQGRFFKLLVNNGNIVINTVGTGKVRL